MQEVINNNSANHRHTVYFCNACLISVVTDKDEICFICRAKDFNRVQVGEDQLRRGLIAIFAVLAIVLLGALIASYIPGVH